MSARSPKFQRNLFATIGANAMAAKITAVAKTKSVPRICCIVAPFYLVSRPQSAAHPECPQLDYFFSYLAFRALNHFRESLYVLSGQIRIEYRDEEKQTDCQRAGDRAIHYPKVAYCSSESIPKTPQQHKRLLLLPFWI